jgi:ABC-type amino acid transport system permease subunit
VFEADVSGDCRHINVFIKVGIDIADYILSIVGALALVVFIYGGILMIISEGSSDRVQQGKNAMVAAFIGLIIIFGAYILVKFVAGVVGVQSGFNLQ